MQNLKIKVIAGSDRQFLENKVNQFLRSLDAGDVEGLDVSFSIGYWSFVILYRIDIRRDGEERGEC